MINACVLLNLCETLERLSSCSHLKILVGNKPSKKATTTMSALHWLVTHGELTSDLCLKMNKI
jgi:hypothetical protein